MSNAGGAESSSSMISLQRSMHSSQMYTPGPAISFLTCRWDLPQKLQRSCSLESVGRAMRFLSAGERRSVARARSRRLALPGSCLGNLASVLRDHAIDDSVLLCLLGTHEVVPLGVLPDFID